MLEASRGDVRQHWPGGVRGAEMLERGCSKMAYHGGSQSLEVQI